MICVRHRIFRASVSLDNGSNSGLDSGEDANTWWKIAIGGPEKISQYQLGRGKKITIAQAHMTVMFFKSK